VQEALGQPNAAEVEAVMEAQPVGPAGDELGRAATDVDHERLVFDRTPARDSAEGQVCLLVAREQPRHEAVAPLDLAEKRLPVLGVADSARRDRERPLGAELLRLAPEVGQDVANARDRNGEEALPLVDPLAEPRDLQPPQDLVHPAVGNVCDEQAGRVRAQIDGTDAHVRKAKP
jgi:hypothetical protein